MNLFEYVPLMKEMNTPFAIAGVVILGIFLVIITLKMLGGMIRGTKRQFVRTLATLAAAIVSFIAATFISNRIIGSLDVNSLEGLIVFIDGYIPGIGEYIRQMLSNINTDIFEYVILLPATLFILPFLTTVAFLLVNLVFKIIRGIITKIFNFKKAKNPPQRLGGAVLAAIEALIWIMMITLPISAVTSLIDDVFIEAIETCEEEEKKAELTENYEQYLLPFTQNPALCFVEQFGSVAMADKIATVNIGDEVTNLRDEVLDVSHLILVDATDLNGADLFALTEAQKVAVSSIIDTLYTSPYMSNLLVGMLNGAPGAIDSGIIPIQMTGEYTKLFNEILAYFKGVSRASLGSDLTTVKDLYFALSDSGVLSAAKEGGNIMELLQEKRREGDDTVNKIVAILKANKRSAPMVTALTEALISTLSGGIETEGGVTVTYDSLKNGMNDVLAVDREDFGGDEEAYMEALSGTLDTTLRDHGIQLEPEIVDSIAEYVDTNYSSQEELTDEEFNDVLLHYYDAYLDYVELGKIPDEFQ